MERVAQRIWGTFPRLSPVRARLLAGLSVAILALAVAGLAGGPDEGPAGVLNAVFLALVGVTDLCWAAGSLLPEERGGAALRGVARPLAAVMLALAIVVLVRLALQLTGRA